LYGLGVKIQLWEILGLKCNFGKFWGQNVILESLRSKCNFGKVLGSKCDFGKVWGQNVICGILGLKCNLWNFGVEM
jgi:hypothetical protein